MKRRFAVTIHEKYSTLLGALYCFGIYCFDVVYMILFGRAYLDSDMAAEMILSDLLNKSHSILSENWYYSTELRVFEMQWLYRLGLLIFPNNWHLARLFGISIALLLLAVCTYALGRLVLSRRDLPFWLAGLVLSPLCYRYFWFTIFGGYYIPYMVYSLLTIILLLRILKTDSRTRRVLLYLPLCLIAFCSGLNGVRQLMVLYVPLLLACIITRLRSKLFLPGFTSFLFAIGGLMVNTKVLAPRYHFRDYMQCAQWGNGTNSWLESLQQFFYSYGYYQDSNLGHYWDNPIDLFSKRGIALGFGILAGIVVLIAFILVIRNYKELDSVKQFLVLCSLSMLFVIAFTFTYIMGAPHYWIQTLVFGLLILGIATEHLPIKKAGLPYLIPAFIAAIFVVSGAGIVKSSLNIPAHSSPDYEKVTDWILENTDYTVGVSDFWNSDVITELSNGKIDMYTITDLSQRPDASLLYTWLQKVEHKDSFPTGNFFVLYPYHEDMSPYENALSGYPASRIYDDGELVVYGVISTALPSE